MAKMNSELPINNAYLQKLVSQLAVCIPNLDANKMLENPYQALEKQENSTSLLHWLYDALDAQNMIVYEEWKEYWGDMPALAPLKNIDTSQFDTAPLLDAIDKKSQQTEDSGEALFDYYFLPYVEYQNDFLQKFGLKIITFATENLYMMCVKDNADEIEKLSQILAEKDLGLINNNALNLSECIKALAQ